jgi:hypothetical protein
VNAGVDEEEEEEAGADVVAATGDSDAEVN